MTKNSFYISLLTGSIAIPLLVSARTYDTSHLPYSDSPNDRATAVAISVLTEEDILEGNPDGTFRPNSTLNRAEFVTIAMRLLPPAAFDAVSCFPDVAASAWYAEDVCRAKSLGIVRGNAVAGVPESQWKFEPSRPVQYEEAVKVLVNLNAIVMDHEESGADPEWYAPYLLAAARLNLDVEGLRAGETLTRGEMAKLTANFFAYSHEELDQLHAAQSSSRSSSSRSSARTSSSRSSSRSSLLSSFSASSQASLDPISDVSIRGRFVLLGEVSPVLGAVNVFNNNEPFQVDTYIIDMDGSTPSIASILVYNDQKEYIGRASHTTTGKYELNVRSRNIIIPKREEYTFYVRADTRDSDSGGVSGEDLHIAEMGVSGFGVWTEEEYTKMSTEVFPTFQAADAVLTAITNAGPEKDPLVGGPGYLIGSFNFAGDESDVSAQIHVTDLSMYLATTGGISVSSIVVKDADSPETHSCSLASNVVTCENISAGIGAVDEGAPTNILVYANVTVPGGTSAASLQLTLIEPGTYSTPGAVTWTDGTTEFTWVGDESPVARGTYYSI